MSDASPPCVAHPDLVGFKYPLMHLTESLTRRQDVKIVAIGSSSTAGEGGILPYPRRLELVMRNRFPDRTIDVLNRGGTLNLDLRTRIEAAEDDQRIVSISAYRASATAKQGSIDIDIWHTGISELTWHQRTFTFRHVGNEGDLRLSWKSVYSVDFNRISNATRSSADVSLLETLMSGTPGLELFARIKRVYSCPGFDVAGQLPESFRLGEIGLRVSGVRSEECGDGSKHGGHERNRSNDRAARELGEAARSCDGRDDRGRERQPSRPFLL